MGVICVVLCPNCWLPFFSGAPIMEVVIYIHIYNNEDHQSYIRVYIRVSLIGETAMCPYASLKRSIRTKK